MAAAPLFSVRWVDSIDAIPPELWEGCFGPPVEGRWWYSTLEKSGLEDQFTFSYGVISDANGISVGIVPVFLMDVPLDIIAPQQLAGLVRFAGKFARLLRYQRTLFVGSPCSDEGTVGLTAGVELDDVTHAVQAALDQKAAETKTSMIVWKDFAAHDSPALENLMASNRLFRVISYPGARIELGKGGFDGYMKSLKSSRRYKLKKKLREGSEALPTETVVLQQPGGDLLDEIFILFWQTYSKGKTKFEKLNRRFFELIAAEPTSYFILLKRKDSQKLVAFMLCFDCGTRAINKFIGIDYSIENAFLYFQLWAQAVRWASERGFKELQSGQTGYRAKLEVGNELVPLTNYARCRNPLVHKLFAWQARGISWDTIDPDLKTAAAPNSEEPPQK